MTISRALLAGAAALFSSLVSVDPEVSAPPRPHRSIRPALASASPSLAGNAVEAPTVIEAPIPPDLTVELRRDPGGRGRNLVVSRPGHLVALAHGSIRAAGKDWASMHLDVKGPGSGASPVAANPGAPAGKELDRVVWETTPLGALTTLRGLVSLTLDGDQLGAHLAMMEAPTPAGRFDGAHHSCAAHRDTSGGFVVLCRLHHGAQKVSALNLTSFHALEGAWVIPGKEPLVRLDIPLSPGLAEARLIGFVHGANGAVIRAEAAWAPGEEPTLLMDESERRQPAPF